MTDGWFHVADRPPSRPRRPLRGLAAFTGFPLTILVAIGAAQRGACAVVLAGPVSLGYSSAGAEGAGAQPKEYAEFLGATGGRRHVVASHEVPSPLEQLEQQPEHAGDAVLARHGGGGCPSFEQTRRGLDQIRQRSCLGPVDGGTGNGVLSAAVSGSTQAARPKPVTLFLLVPPYWGSTALLSLIASSPRATTLCGSGSANCEGTWLLIKEGLMQRADRWEPQLPDWNEALSLYERIWDEGMPVRVEKSPPNIAKVAQLLEHFAAREDEVAFLVMTRSPCFGAEAGETEWRHYARILAGAVDVLRQAGARHMTVRYEDLLLDPYATASKILGFLPTLESLDPGVNNLPALGGKFGENSKDKSIVRYVLEEGPFANQRSTAVGPAHVLARRLGY